MRRKVKGVKSAQYGDAEEKQGIAVIQELTLRFDLELLSRRFPSHLATRWAGVRQNQFASSSG